MHFDEVIVLGAAWWRHQMETFPRYWPFVRGPHRSPANSPHKGQWRGALMFSLICAWTNGWANNQDAGDLRRHRAHYDVTVMDYQIGHSTHKSVSTIYLIPLHRHDTDSWNPFPCKELPFLKYIYHGCWCADNEGSHGISNHDTYVERNSSVHEC